MKTWFRSSKGALILSFAAMLSLLARSYYDIRYILVEEYSALMPGMDTLWIFGFTAIVGGNMAVLFWAATSNRRSAWIALFAFNLVNGLGCGAASLLVFTSNVLEIVLFIASLVTGTLAAAAVGTQLRRRKVDTVRAIW